MAWYEDVQRELVTRPVGGYVVGQSPATEPTAWAALALCSAEPASGDAIDAAATAADWLAGQQSDAGTLGVTPQQATPNWPTSLAILAWLAVDAAMDEPRFSANVESAIAGLLKIEGKKLPPNDVIGHDPTLVGWPWVVGTHTWLEPTAFAVLALRATGHRDHNRTLEAMMVLEDRQIEGGGHNYGNTSVLGQRLVPHVQPTALVLMALASDHRGQRLADSLAWLQQEWPRVVGLSSRCFATMALAAYEVLPEDAQQMLQREYQRVDVTDRSTHQLALLLAAHRSPLQWLPSYFQDTVDHE